MSKIVSINRFDGGIADDYVNGASGECSISKQFDILSHPFRLQPLRGMTNTGELTGSAMAQMILGSNGIMYGIGEDPANPGKGELYKRTGFGASDFWTDFTTDQLSGQTQTAASGHFDFLVHFPEMTATRKVFWSSTNILVVSDPADAGSSADTEALTFSTIGQGLVHPKDKVLYIPYQTSTATLIYSITSHATDAFGTVNASAFTGISSRFRAFCLSHYGDFLAIPMTVTGIPGESVVGLWDRNTATTVFSQTIPWGNGLLKVLNNLNGALIGVSVLSNELGGSAAQDLDKIQIKVYEGGAEPYIIKEITALRLTTTQPACVLNHRVNFIHNNRLYFSANIVNGNSNANYYGLWSVGKNKLGRWTVVLERVATNDNSETGILAAALYGDFLSCVHTSAGTLTYTLNGNTLASIYDATSVYETCLNPEMPAEDRRKKKQLEGVYVKTLPLPAAASVVIKYRVDSNKDDSWTTIVTGTTDDETLFEAVDASGTKLKDFTDVEFRLESVDGAQIIEFGYKYNVLKSLI